MPVRKRSSSRRSQRITRIPKPRRGTLTRHGYSANNTASSRHAALKRAVRAETPLSVFRKLNLLMIYNRRGNPRMYTIFRRDRDWVKRNYMRKAR